jgi:hypothetical protein
MPPKVPTVDPCIGCRDFVNGPRCIGSDGCRDYHALAAAYLKLPAVDENARTIPHNYAFDCVFSMTTESAEDALAFVFVALEHAGTAKQEAYLAAGALEHLLRRHGALVIDRVLGAARQDQKFRRCLASVWGHSAWKKQFAHGSMKSLLPPRFFRSHREKTSARNLAKIPESAPTSRGIFRKAC